MCMMHHVVFLYICMGRSPDLTDDALVHIFSYLDFKGRITIERGAFQDKLHAHWCDDNCSLLDHVTCCFYVWTSQIHETTQYMLNTNFNI